VTGVGPQCTQRRAPVNELECKQILKSPSEVNLVTESTETGHKVTDARTLSGEGAKNELSRE